MAAIVRAVFARKIDPWSLDGAPCHAALVLRLGGKMFITPAFAQGGLFGGDSSSMLVQFMPLILIIVIMYFLILRPQQQKVKQHQAMIKALRRGDTVVTNGGLVAKVTKVVDDDQIEVEIADGVRVRQMRGMVSDVRAKGEPVKDDSAA
jgi:preprotein translocase subunit YajC